MREISFEEKRVYVPTPMVQKSFFMLPVVVIPIVQDTVVTTPIVSSPVATINEHEEHVLQDPLEPVVTHEEEQQQPHIEQTSSNEAPRRSQRVQRSAISEDYEVYECEEFQMEGDPTSFEEAMRNAHSSKWVEAMEDEIKSIKINDVWDLEIILK